MVRERWRCDDRRVLLSARNCISFCIIWSSFRTATMVLDAEVPIAIWYRYGYVCPDGHPRVVEPTDDLSAKEILYYIATSDGDETTIILRLYCYYYFRFIVILLYWRRAVPRSCVPVDSRKTALRYAILSRTCL